ncbi:SDR family oxidoreductase [Cryptosporangium aurantiacum]|uniref:Short-chain dehydrogenase n=1 Tax=Cryptosporangium aurantiacum TaxID=134849 RepID=A0A1M7QB31_9ACTN|nr:SDR family oxidoreductase [Cryptosporangium aurantiacum]SHN27985.1 Short-chain dehydrogenase [Cryptosporangium aurantiacum]
MPRSVRSNILITGASSGLGAGMAREFAARGRNLALCARRLDQLETLREELVAANPGIRVAIHSLDVTDHDAVFRTFRSFASGLGQIDRVVVNAGLGKGASLGTGRFAANRETAETNFVAALAQCEAAMELFREQNSGHLVVISSVAALRGARRAQTVYAATKAGLSTLAEGVRMDVVGTPIRVSAIHPGYIRTAINEKVAGVPFIVDAETGCRALARAIEREPATAYVPGWPWRLIAPLYRIAPAALLRKIV